MIKKNEKLLKQIEKFLLNNSDIFSEEDIRTKLDIGYDKKNILEDFIDFLTLTYNFILKESYKIKDVIQYNKSIPKSFYNLAYNIFGCNNYYTKENKWEEKRKWIQKETTFSYLWSYIVKIKNEPEYTIIPYYFYNQLYYITIMSPIHKLIKNKIDLAITIILKFMYIFVVSWFNKISPEYISYKDAKEIIVVLDIFEKTLEKISYEKIEKITDMIYSQEIPTLTEELTNKYQHVSFTKKLGLAFLEKSLIISKKEMSTEYEYIIYSKVMKLFNLLYDFKNYFNSDAYLNFYHYNFPPELKNSIYTALLLLIEPNDKNVRKFSNTIFYRYPNLLLDSNFFTPSSATLLAKHFKENNKKEFYIETIKLENINSIITELEEE